MLPREQLQLDEMVRGDILIDWLHWQQLVNVYFDGVDVWTYVGTVHNNLKSLFFSKIKYGIV